MDKSTFIPEAKEVKAEAITVEQAKADAAKILFENMEADHGFIDVGGMTYDEVRYLSRGE